jgi:2-amino-4-hydroxy-6-hydroxymethyldihydropteridine diphosphokinase
VDIVAYADVVSDDPVLTLPHPRAHERAFVLAPWYDVEPEAQLPGRGPVAHLLADVPREGVAPRADLELQLPE